MPLPAALIIVRQEAAKDIAKWVAEKGQELLSVQSEITQEVTLAALHNSEPGGTTYQFLEQWRDRLIEGKTLLIAHRSMLQNLARD